MVIPFVVFGWEDVGVELAFKLFICNFSELSFEMESDIFVGCELTFPESLDPRLNFDLVVMAFL